MSRRRANSATLKPDDKLSSTICSFSAAVHAAAVQDRSTPSPSSCVHLNLPVNRHTLAYIHARVQARLAKRLRYTHVATQ